jgi:hypothetical protein
MTHNFYRNSLYYRGSESCFLARILSHSPGIRLAGKVFSGNGADFGSGDCPTEAPLVIEFSNPNGATRSPVPKTQSPRRRSPEQCCPKGDGERWRLRL